MSIGEADRTIGGTGTAHLALWPLIVLASGLYTVLPGSGYAILALSLLLILSDDRLRAAPARYWHPRQICGFALFNAVFLAWGVVHTLEARTYLLHLFTLTMFLVSFAAARVSGDRAEPGALEARDRVAVVGLALLLAGQLAQSAGWLQHVRAPAAGFEVSLVFRPGGFQNANMTAAIALLLLWSMLLHLRGSVTGWGWIGLSLAIVVIGLTQSRAGLLALALYGVWIFRRYPWRMLAVAMLALGAAFWSGVLQEGALLVELVDRFAARFRGDESSAERAWLLRTAWDALQTAPLFGQGHAMLETRYGVGGSHNQVIELLVSFGAIGGLAMMLAGVLLLWPLSGLFVLVGVLPSLLFSHNYFDSASFQAALGIGLAADRLAAVRRMGSQA